MEISQIDCFLSFFSSSRDSFCLVCSINHSGSLLDSSISSFLHYLLTYTRR
jgi:hypothetical protein